jgi:putative membrane protein
MSYGKGFLVSLNWFRLATQLKGSIIPAVWGRTLVCSGFGILVSFLYALNLPVNIPVLVAFVPNIVLGLLLVFRTNTAYERFWEGRKCWGSLVNSVRNLARQIWIAVQEKTIEDRQAKIATLKLLVAFALAMKLHLRQQSPNQELLPFVSPAQFQSLQVMNNPPLQVAVWIGDYLQEVYLRGCLTMYQLSATHKLLDSMVDALGVAERILKTPIPLAYALHLKQLLLIYCLSLPFQLVEGVGWLTGPIVGIFSFTLLGIEEIGIEIENPFGTDPNDLPLDAICHIMQRNIDDLISITPRASSREGSKPSDSMH